MNNPAYKVDLKATHAECEANFWRLLKLLPEHHNRQAYWVNLGAERLALITFEVEQRSVYTTMLRIEWQSDFSWQERHVFTVRVYHDAAMAEVMSYQNKRANKGRYYYPNRRMYHPDEKHQHNAFLTEILSSVLKHGAVVDSLPAQCTNVLSE